MVFTVTYYLELRNTIMKFLLKNHSLPTKFKWVVWTFYNKNDWTYLKPMLDQYIGECTVSIININVDSKELTHGQNYHTIQILIYDRHVERKSLYAWGNIRVNTILNHIDTRMIMPRYEGLFMVYKPEWYQKRKYRQISIPYLISKKAKSSLDIPKVCGCYLVCFSQSPTSTD